MTQSSTARTLRGYQIGGFLGIGLLVGALGSWAVMAPIQGAVIAPGVTVVESYLKRIQHRDGGIVVEIAVKEGDHVEAGALLIKLDETDTRAELAILQSMLDEFEAKRSRLVAERDDLSQISFPESLETRTNDRHIADLNHRPAEAFCRTKSGTDRPRRATQRADWSTRAGSSRA